MTKQQIKEVFRVCGPNIEESDIPALWRQGKPEIEVSMEYPLGGMVERYDIEREKELTK